MALVRRLCVNPGMSRSDLSASLGLTRSTVTNLVRDLLADGWLLEREVVTTGDPGRRPTPLFIDPHRLLLLGADVSVKSVRVVAVSLAGEVLAPAWGACRVPCSRCARSSTNRGGDP
jgi:DNA-binding Lrp family transcriptional regulator